MSDFPISSAPPKVDFSTPYSPFKALLLQRGRLADVLREIDQASRDISGYDAEGARNANLAAGWAATLMVANILKTGLSAVDRRVALLFKVADRRIAKANQVMKILGGPTLATRKDVLKTVDPNLRGTVEMLDDVRKVRAFLKDNKVPTNKDVDLVLDIGITMAEDAALIMQAGQTRQAVHDSASAAQANLRRTLDRTKASIRRIDEEILRMMAKADIVSRTA